MPLLYLINGSMLDQELEKSISVKFVYRSNVFAASWERQKDGERDRERKLHSDKKSEDFVILTAERRLRLFL